MEIMNRFARVAFLGALAACADAFVSPDSIASSVKDSTPGSFSIALQKAMPESAAPQQPSGGMTMVEIQDTNNDHRYVGQIYQGSEKVPVNVSFDTGSSYLVLTSELCNNCHSKVFKQISSSTERCIGTQWALDFPNQGVDLKTIEFQDTICLQTSDYCATNFNFFAIFSQNGMKPGVDGILGIAPIQKGGDDTSFVGALKQQGIITHSIVAFFFASDDSQSSSVQIGDYNSDLVQNGDQGIEWYEINDEEEWQTVITAAKFGDSNIFGHDQKTVQIDSSVAGIGLDRPSFGEVNRIANKIDDSFTCNTEVCFSNQECETFAGKVPDFKIQLDNREFYSIPGAQLLVKGRENACELVFYNNNDKYKLGSVFLQNFYSIYDLEYGKIGLGALKSSNAEEIVIEGVVEPQDADSVSKDSTTPEQSKSEKNPNPDLEVVGGLILIFTLLGGLLLFMNLQKSQHSQQRPEVLLGQEDSTSAGSRVIDAENQ